MPGRSAGLMRVRRRPGMRSRGILIAGRRAIPVVLRRSGIHANKREGDGATPRGSFRVVRLWWRADRLPRPRSLLPGRRITPDLAWSENPRDRRDKQPIPPAAQETCGRPWRGRGPPFFFFLTPAPNPPPPPPRA